MNARLLAVPCLLLCATPAAAGVIVVDSGGGAGSDFAEIRDAVQASADGDVILVRSGTYLPFGVQSRSLSIVADAGASVHITGEVTVRTTPANGEVLLRGLVADNAARLEKRGLVLGANTGPVFVEDCTFAGSHGWQDPDTWFMATAAEPGVYGVGNAHVALVRCTVRGGSGFSQWDEHNEPYPTSASSAVELVDSSVYVYASTFEGGFGGSEYDTSSHGGGDGGDGLRMTGGFAYVSGATVRGGGGGSADADAFGCGDGGAGGFGLRLWNNATGFHASTTFEGAPGGFAFAPCSPGSDGAPIYPVGGATDLGEPDRRLAIESPVREAQVAVLTAEGPVGERVYAWAGPLDPMWLPGLAGVRLVSAQHRVVPMGWIPASGVLVRNLPMPTLPGALPSVQVLLQGLFVNPGAGTERLSSASLLVLLDSGL